MSKEYEFDKTKSVEPVNSTSNVTRRILRSDANVLRLSVVTLFCIFLAFVILAACSLPSVFFEFTDDIETLSDEIVAILSASTLLLIACFVFIFLPIASGVIFFVKLTVDGEHPRFADVFYAFRTGKRYFRSMLLPVVLAIRAMLVVLPLVGGILNLPILSPEYAESSLLIAASESAFVLFATIAAVAVGAYISSYLYFVPYLVVAQSKGMIPAIKLSVYLARTRRMEILRMSLRSMLYAVISVASFLIFWVVYAMPQISVSYFVYCNEVIRDENYTNE